MASTSFRSYLSQVGISCLALLGYLPLVIRNLLADFLSLVFRIIHFRKRSIRENITLAFPEMTEVQQNIFIKKVYDHFAKLLVEDIALLTYSTDKLLSTCKIYNLEIVDKIIKEGQGFFVLAGHIGNWELGLAALVAKGYHAQTVVKEIKGQLGQAFVDRMRNQHRVGTILRSDNAGRKILSALKNSEAIGFVLDQNMTSDEGIFVNFFGKPACTMPGLAVLSRRSKVPVVPIRFERTPDGVHEIWILPPVTFNLSEDKKIQIQEVTQECTTILETMICLAPTQWLWMHRRWRTQP